MILRNQQWPLLKSVLCCLILSSSTTIYADPPSRVARLSDFNGTVSFSPAGDDNWVYATRNRPLVTGDKLWNDDNSQSLLQLGGATIGIGANSSVEILNLDNNIAQIQLTQGTLLLNIDRLKKGQTFEIDTPNLAFSVNQTGYFHINVDSEGKVTTILVPQGQGEAYGEKNSYIINEGQAFSFTGTDLGDYQQIALPEPDELDKWFASHFSRPAKGVANQQVVSPDVVGYEDLNQYGSWENDEQNGNVWYPSQVSNDWAPYRDGDFVWVEPWGWTWVGEEAWGFAPYHYGRWAYNNRWGWVPGPYDGDPVYAPALIGFLAGVLLAQASDNVAWFPLGPGEVYYPSYATSRNYFNNVNAGNTFIRRKDLNNAYRHPHQRDHFRNINAPNAITGAPRNSFGRAQAGNKNFVKIPPDQLKNAKFTDHVNVAPDRNSLTGSARQAKKTPASNILNRPIIAKSKVPPAAVPFSAKQEQLQQAPGKPLEPNVMSGLQKAAPERTRQIKNVTPGAPVPLQHEERAGRKNQPHAGQAPRPPKENVPVQTMPKNNGLTTEPTSPGSEQLQAPSPKRRAPSQRTPQPSGNQPIINQPEQVPPTPRAPRQETPRREAPRQAAPRQEAPRREVPRQVAPRQEAPRQAAPRQEAPRQAAPRQEAPRQAAPRQEAPRQATPRQEAPRIAPPPAAPRVAPPPPAPRVAPPPPAPRVAPPPPAPRAAPPQAAPQQRDKKTSYTPDDDDETINHLPIN